MMYYSSFTPRSTESQGIFTYGSKSTFEPLSHNMAICVKVVNARKKEAKTHCEDKHLP